MGIQFETKISADGTHKIEEFVVPNISTAALFRSIPKHLFERPLTWSFAYVFRDIGLILGFVWLAYKGDSYIKPEYISLPHPYFYRAISLAIWSLYGFWTGLTAVGIWCIGHDCGHHAFSANRMINHVVGFILHSAIGVPYHSWRITHADHHAHTGHLTKDGVFVPASRSSAKLPAFNPEKEDIAGHNVHPDVQNALWEALHDTPLSAAINCGLAWAFGWVAYLGINATGQRHYPFITSHFNPWERHLFKPSQTQGIIISDIGIAIWLGILGAWAYYRGAWEVLTVYGVPYAWMNHWLVLIVFLQHTNPLLPHYRPEAFTFSRGALCTVDRSLLGGDGWFGKTMGWIGGSLGHGMCEVHLTHHVASKIPHYNCWEAGIHMKKRIAEEGVYLDAAPANWAEFYRMFKACKFVEDTGSVVFYKDARGLAQRVAVFRDPVNKSDEYDVASDSASDSGIELEDDKTK